MRRPAHVRSGRVAARGFVIDVATIGEAEARRRVLRLVRPGTEVFDLGGGQWLVVLPEASMTDARRSPGLLLVEVSGRLSGAADLEAAGDATYWRAGRPVSWRRADATPLDPADWIDPGTTPAIRLSPVTTPVAPPPAEPMRREPVNLRRTAHVRQRSTESRHIEQSMLRPGNPPPGGRGRRVAGPGAPSRPGLLGRLVDLVGSLTLRSPIGWLVRHQQIAFLQRLVDLFADDLDEALRHAIPLSAGVGQGAGRALTLPRRRERLEISRHGIRRVSSIEVAGPAMATLRRLYEDAAKRLEREGRLEEAAFVMVELLLDVLGGVGLLERHQRWELAATIAEDRRLDPAMGVRLWWLAGRRQRAIDLAKRRGAFGAAILRLATSDPEAVPALRAAWVETLLAAGDPLGAVRAGWPDPDLRLRLRTAVDQGLGLGGIAEAALLAHRLGLEPSADELDETRAYLTGPAIADGALAAAFATALVDVEPTPAVDREFATLVRRALALADTPLPAVTVSQLAPKLDRRIDRLLLADAPPLRGARAARGAGQPDIATAGEVLPGLHPVADAVPLASGRTLVALGEAGCRLLASDGHPVASWDTPVHRLVAADHGGAALLLADRGSVTHVTVLDLASRRLAPYGPVRLRGAVDTYDGVTWVTVDDGGSIAILDLLAARPTISWREVNSPELHCLAVVRGARELLAVVDVGAGTWWERRQETWRWSLPDMYLRWRTRVETPPGEALGYRLLTNGSLIWRMVDGTYVAAPPVRPLAGVLPGTEVLTSQSHVAIVAPRRPDEVDLLVRADPFGSVRAILTLGWAGLGYRAVGDRIAAWDGTGRLVTLDLTSGTVVSAVSIGL